MSKGRGEGWGGSLLASIDEQGEGGGTSVTTHSISEQGGEGAEGGQFIGHTQHQ